MSEAVAITERQKRSSEWEFTRPPESLWRDAWKRLLRNRAAVVSGIFLLIIIIFAIFADDGIISWALGRESRPLLAPYDYQQADFYNTRARPSLQRTPEGGFPHLMGTDKYGRDVFSRVVYGSRISLAVGVLCSLVIMTFGMIYGAISGYLGGRVDTLMMRFVDILYGLPTLLFIILIMVILGSTAGFAAVRNLVLGIGLVSWMGMSRLVRGQFLSLREKEFVEAARMIGARDVSIIGRHMLPNSLGPIIVTLTLNMPNLILYEAVLSFIGLGVPPPFPSWGQMINDGWQAMRTNPHLLVFPAVTLSLVMMAFNFVGDGLRDALDPQMRGTT
jgi:oligopeptide transport system permease protein